MYLMSVGRVTDDIDPDRCWITRAHLSMRMVVGNSWRVTKSKGPEQTSHMTSDPGLDCLRRSVCSIHMCYLCLYKMYIIMFVFP